MAKKTSDAAREESARGGGLERDLHYDGAVGVEYLEALPPREALGRPVDCGREGAVGHQLLAERDATRLGLLLILRRVLVERLEDRPTREQRAARRAGRVAGRRELRREREPPGLHGGIGGGAGGGEAAPRVAAGGARGAEVGVLGRQRLLAQQRPRARHGAVLPW
eukprot:scaffold1226_cov54-Phaeocystis_antarctica.AAC.4